MPSAIELWKLKVICRWSLAFVWIWEGLVPKILGPTAMQRDLVLRSGLFWPDPDRFLVGLGLLMIVAGIAIGLGWLERAAVLTASVTMTILIFLVVGFHPDSLKDMHGGIAKDACLYAVAWVVWRLSPLVPSKPTPSAPCLS